MILEDIPNKKDDNDIITETNLIVSGYVVSGSGITSKGLFDTPKRYLYVI